MELVVVALVYCPCYCLDARTSISSTIRFLSKTIMRIGNDDFFKSIVEVRISEEMRQQADAGARALGVLKNSVMHGQSNIYGKMGELISHKVLGGKFVDHRDYDIVLPRGQTADVKTKGRAVPPQAHFDCSVSDFNTQQRCDVYVFASVLKDLSIGWVLGWYPKDAFYQEAHFYHTGDHDVRNGWVCRADSWGIDASKLYAVGCL